MTVANYLPFRSSSFFLSLFSSSPRLDQVRARFSIRAIERRREHGYRDAACRRQARWSREGPGKEEGKRGPHRRRPDSTWVMLGGGEGGWFFIRGFAASIVRRFSESLQPRYANDQDFPTTDASRVSRKRERERERERECTRACTCTHRERKKVHVHTHASVCWTPRVSCESRNRVRIRDPRVIILSVSTIDDVSGGSCGNIILCTWN